MGKGIHMLLSFRIGGGILGLNYPFFFSSSVMVWWFLIFIYIYMQWAGLGEKGEGVGR